MLAYIPPTAEDANAGGCFAAGDEQPVDGRVGDFTSDVALQPTTKLLMLVAADQRLFRRLAASAGGFTLLAAATICQTSEDADRPVLDGFASLVDKNLLRREIGRDGELRFAMLETIRQFALEQLSLSGEQDTLGDRHANFFTTLAEQARWP